MPQSARDFLTDNGAGASARSFLTSEESPKSARSFLTSDDTPEQIRARYDAPGSTALPSGEEARRVWEGDRNRPIPEKISSGIAAAGSAVYDTAKNVLGTGKKAIEEVAQDLGKRSVEFPQALAQRKIEPDALLKYSQKNGSAFNNMMATGQEAFLRGTYDLGMLGRKAANNINDDSRVHAAEAGMEPPVDPAELFHKRWLDDLKYKRVRQQPGSFSGVGDVGTDQEGSAPYENASEAASYLLDPTPVGVGASMLAKGAAKKIGENVATRMAQKVGAGAEKVEAAVRAPANFVRGLEENLAGGSTPLSQTLRAPAATVALGTRSVGKVAEGVEQASKTVGDSTLTRADQLGMAESVPSGVRNIAQLARKTGVDEVLDSGLNVAKSAGTGAAIGGALALPGAENAEEVGQAAGAGLAMGGLTHLALAPTTAGPRKKLAEANDFQRWMEKKSPEEQSTISQFLSPESAVKVMTMDTVLNGVMEQAAPNVVMKVLTPEEYAQKGGGDTGGFASEAEGKPTIYLNAAKMDDGTAFHEAWHHLIRSPDIVDYNGFVTELIGVHDDAGNIIKPGVLDSNDLKKFGDAYWNRLPDQAKQTLEANGVRKEIFDLDPNNPEAKPWRDLIVSEIGAELFSNLGKDTPGNFIDSVGSSKLAGLFNRLNVGIGERIGNALLGKFGSDPKAVSAIMPGLKGTPEIESLMRNFVRNKLNAVETPSFEGPMIKDSAVKLSVKDISKNPEMLQKFGHLDYFKKNPDGSIMMKGLDPVIMNPREIKQLEKQRVNQVKKALESVPDSGETGIVRPASKTLSGTAPPAKGAGATMGRTPEHWAGRKLSAQQEAAILALPDDVLTPKTKENLKAVNKALSAEDGSTLLTTYSGQTEKRAMVKGGVIETVRPTAPLSIHLSKASALYYKALDVRALYSKVQRFASKRAQFFEPFGGSQAVFMEKFQQALKNHVDGLPGKTGLDADPAKAEKMWVRINDMVNIRDLASEANNPERFSGRGYEDQLIKSFRIDRINSLEPMKEKYPISVELQKAMFQPDPTPKSLPSERPREGGGYTSLILPDGTAFVGERAHPLTWNKVIDLGLAKDADLYNAKSAFTRPDGTSFNLQGEAIPTKKIVWLHEVTPQKHPLSDPAKFEAAVVKMMAEQGISKGMAKARLRIQMEKESKNPLPSSEGGEQKVFSPSPGDPIAAKRTLYDQLGKRIATTRSTYYEKRPDRLAHIREDLPEWAKEVDQWNALRKEIEAAERPPSQPEKAPEQVTYPDGPHSVELYHGTKRQFDKFQTGVPDRWGRSTTDRIYMSEEPDAAFDAARPGKGAKQVSVAEYALKSDEDYGMLSKDDFYDLDPADQNKVIANLKTELSKVIDSGGVMISTRDDGGYGIVTKEDLASLNMDELDNSLIFSKNSIPRILKSKVSGKVLDITRGKELPPGLNVALEKEGRWNRESDYTGFGHEKSVALVEWARQNGYQLIKVPENYETGGKSKTSWIVLPEAFPQSFEDIFHQHVGPYKKPLAQ